MPSRSYKHTDEHTDEGIGVDQAVHDLDYAYFQRKVLSLTGIDLRNYKAGQMRRRLGTLVQRAGVRTFAEYAALLERDPRRRQEFEDFFTINVSEFFRDPQRFEQLRAKILPELARSGMVLRVWSAGCSIGAEPYSLAMLLDDAGLAGRASILATDIDARTLERARRGEGYLPSEVRCVPPRYLERYFTVSDGTYAVVPSIRRMVQFRQHDLLSDPFERNFDLIVCRNVVIYFTDVAKERLYQKFWEALRPGGYLFLGGTEVLSRAQELGFEPRATAFYRKIAPAGAQAWSPVREWAGRGVR